MNSKGIEPRVGMLFSYAGDKRYLHDVETFYVVPVYSPCESEKEDIGKVVGWASRDMWLNGEYEILWIPPTDEERALFREAAEHMRARPVGVCELSYCIYIDEDFWKSGDWNRNSVCDSLALDGADCDNMPEGYV